MFKEALRLEYVWKAGIALHGEGEPATISTGVIEGACRHLVKYRMDITGARWGLRGAEAVLKLRSLCASRDLDVSWAFHENAEHVRNHLDLDAAGPPHCHAVEGRCRAHLRLVR